eukprot:3310880-Amphidinium_carterae.1
MSKSSGCSALGLIHSQHRTQVERVSKKSPPDERLVVADMGKHTLRSKEQNGRIDGLRMIL